MNKFLFLLCLVVAGCAQPRANVLFESAPAGAQVFFGVGANEDLASPKQYLGTTPCTYVLDVNGDGSFKTPGSPVYSSFVRSVAVIEARPSGQMSNCFPQRLVFHGGALFVSPDKAPDKVFFDMARPPEPVKASAK